jgi:hypothetical protein
VKLVDGEVQSDIQVFVIRDYSVQVAVKSNALGMCSWILCQSKQTNIRRAHTNTNRPNWLLGLSVELCKRALV